MDNRLRFYSGKVQETLFVTFTERGGRCFTVIRCFLETEKCVWNLCFLTHSDKYISTPYILQLQSYLLFGGFRDWESVYNICVQHSSASCRLSICIRNHRCKPNRRIHIVIYLVSFAAQKRTNKPVAWRHHCSAGQIEDTFCAKPVSVDKLDKIQVWYQYTEAVTEIFLNKQLKL